MAIPLAFWAAAGLGVAGAKLYQNMHSAENIVKNAIGRYSEEKYKFYKEEEKVLPLVEKLGQEKLSAWSGYTRMFAIMGKIENKPGHYSFKSHRNFYLLPGDIAKLKRIAKLVDEMEQKQLTKVGTGVLTVVALQGGAANTYGAGLDEEENKTILEKINASPLDSKHYGELEELAVFTALLKLPKILGDNAFKKKKGAELSKEDAAAFKHKLDEKSLTLVDATGKLERVNDIVAYVYEFIAKLKKLHWQQLDYMEKLVAKKTNYKEFTPEQKDNLSYGLALGIMLREIARTDIILSSGNVVVINGAGVREVCARAQDLLPVEPPTY